MKIQYCSDLHLEFQANSDYLKKNPLTVSGDILILAGDITILDDEYFNDPFFTFASDNYEKVYWIPGNHEYYYGDLSKFNKSTHIKLKSNISIVNNMSLEFHGVRFIFSTLWSKISDVNAKRIEQSVSDFECITFKNKRFGITEFNSLHNECLNFIKDSLINRTDKTVVITHHLPSDLCNSAAHKNSPINEAFCSELSEYVEKCGANFWIYGHSHFNQKPIYLGNTMLLTNQLGYVQLNEHGSFKPNAYFSI